MLRGNVDQKETIIELVEYEIFGKTKSIGRVWHSKEKVYSPKGGLLILDIVLIVVRVLKKFKSLINTYVFMHHLMILHFTKWL